MGVPCPTRIVCFTLLLSHGIYQTFVSPPVVARGECLAAASRLKVDTHDEILLRARCVGARFESQVTEIICFGGNTKARGALPTFFQEPDCTTVSKFRCQLPPAKRLLIWSEPTPTTCALVSPKL
ncbi:hypothetical protein AUEXF2481DRAFT_223574 [Aureobasidium subglaciale EXF-2481]|uniref:Uncharacterized protein n=1 Tax=Aureobasidium subglaciale (strain EXF-2481) TaxID=1043005 RepID=A0A074YHH3_AURSE|nr:uncharacterized protein AUEXF2481DRAFT_223574 [Aureobasidium subglaciale EXF-2481]KEQ95529.1 hypothetical protein AUEXF2481DRAFT_223574 [Aureobasidium subglaciale EXF-2481]